MAAEPGAVPHDEGPYSDDESYDSADDALIRNIGEHPLLAPVQEVLFKQLETAHERVRLELREKEEEVVRSKKEREDVGVELYTVQQQLAKLQLQLEATHNSCNLIQGIRVKTDEDLKAFREGYKKRKSDIESEDARLNKSKEELDSIMATIKQVEHYNEEMKSEIAVTRRQAYKADEVISTAEKAKRDQDYYIDHLQDEMKRASEKLALYDAQLKSQKEETAAAAATLKEATEEMNGISAEKRRLLGQWKSFLIGMQRRDEILQATLDSLRKQQEMAQAMDSEIAGFKSDISKAQVESAKLHEALDKEENEGRYLEGQLAITKRSREALAERYAMLKKSLEQTDGEAARLRIEEKTLLEAIATSEQNRQTVERERMKIEDGIATNLSTQTTVKKAARNLHRTALKVVGAIHEKEMEKAQMENELARVKVDALNTKAHNDQLNETLSAIVKDLREKDALIEKYEMEIRQRNDAIEKKMYLVDRLNRRYEKLTAGKEDENMGPLEATIKNISKQIMGKQDESEALQRKWLTDQTALVEIANDVESKSKEVRELSSQLILLNQKRLRLDRGIDAQLSEVKELESGIAQMHKDMVRLNTLVSNNAAATKKLADDNFAMEKGFVESLKEMERESIGLEAKIAGLKDEKATILEDILETERQLVLWEKKIAIERETQAALDPEVGQSEAKEMEKEIHRMRLRYDTLRRDQQRMVKEMERAIVKREAIAVRFRGKKDKGAGGAPTKAGVKKRIANIGRALKVQAVDTQGYEQAIKMKNDELKHMETVVESESKNLEDLEAEAAELQQAINTALYDKQRSIERLASIRRAAARYDAVMTGRRPQIPDSEAGRAREALEHAQAVRENTRAVIDTLSASHTDMAEVLGRVAQLLDI